MTFANPAAWWLATLVVPIIALHILRAQRTEVVVSSTIEWESVDRPVAAARPWQRLRWSIPLVLQLLFVLLLTAALAGPAWDTGRVSAQHVIVMVDTSASMGSADGSPNRLADARESVRDLLDDLGANTRVSLISTGSPARIVAGEVPLDEVGAHLEQLEVSEGGFDAEATGSLAASLDRPDRSVDNVLVSDGGLDDAAIRQLPPGTRLRPVGASDRNLGVTNVVVTPRGGSQMHVQATVTNAGDREVTDVLRFDVDDRTQTTASVRVPAGESTEVGADVPLGERVEVLLEGGDLLRIDDHAYAAGPALGEVQVLVVGAENPFLDALLAADEQLGATRISSEELDTSGDAAFDGVDVAVFDRAPLPEGVPVPYLAIAPPGGTPVVNVTGEVTDPVPTLVRGDTELLEGIDLSGLLIATAQQVEAPAASTLVAAEGAPLLLAGRDGSSAFVYLAAPLEETNLGLLPAFPVLGDRILAELGRTDLVAGGLRAGDVLELDAATEALVRSPSGTETTVAPGTAAPDLDRTGFWQVAVPGQPERTVVVNPDPAETDVRPTEELAIPGVAGGLDGEGEPVTRSLVMWLLLAAILVLIAEWLVSRRRRGVTLRQWRLSEYLRAAVVVLLVLAIWSPGFERSSTSVATVFVVDVSDSMSGAAEQARSLVAEALEDQPSGSVAGVVVVGAQARVDAAVREDLRWSQPSAVVDGSATDLAAGLRVAGALVPADKARRVVLVSDGQATAGGSLRTETNRLSRSGVVADVIAVDPTFGADVSVTSVEAPSRARPGDDVTIVVNLSATTAQQVSVALLRDGEQVDQRLVDAPVGASSTEFTQPAGESAAIEWTARVAGPDNGVFENDESRASTRVEGRASVLVIEGVPGGSAGVAAALAAGGATTTVSSPEQLGGLSELSAFDAVVLVNVSADRLGGEQTEALSAAVRDLGKGMVVLGGTASFGAADYLGSDLEELLPVVSEAQDPKRRSKIAQVFAVDVSGSMGACHCAEDSDGSNSRLAGGVTKTDIARDAAVLSLEEFRPDDELGVLALDDSHRWLLDLAPVGDGSEAKAQMDDIEHTDGATVLDPSLELSAQRLRESGASLRHIVLFTDGFTDLSKLAGLAQQAAVLRDEGITVSVMGTGEGASAELRAIADAGGGRYYAGRDLKELPELLLEETRVVARQLVVEGDFLPEVSSNDAVVGTFDEAPPLRGYLATTAKPTATQHLRIGEEQDPLLATWRVGLGQVAAWTSDAGERWASNWNGWDGSVQFWSAVLRSVLPTPAGAAELSFDGATAQVTAAFDEAVPDGAEVIAQVVDPNGRPLSVRLARLDANTFEGTVEVGPAGTYGVGITSTIDGEVDAAISTTAELGYSREYLTQGADVAVLEELSAQSGGRGVIRPRQSFDADGLEAGRYRVELARWFVLLALLLWPVAIALSRIRRRSGALAVDSLRRPGRFDDLAGMISSRRGRVRATDGRPEQPEDQDVDASSAYSPESPPPTPPAAPPTAPPAAPLSAPPTAPPAGPPTAAPGESGSSTLDSLLEAKRRRRREES